MTTLRQKRQSDMLMRVFAVADAHVVSNRKAIHAAIREAAQRIRERVDPRDRFLAETLIDFAAFSPPPLSTGAEEAVVALRLIAALTTRRETGKVFPAKRRRVATFAASPEIAALNALDPLYAQAGRWMRRRALATRAELAEAADAIAVLAPDVPRDLIEAEVRRQAVAFAGAPTTEMAKIFRDEIAKSVKRGETVGDFLAAIDKATARGKLLPRMDSYLHTVYRTETSNAYSEQRQRDWAHPDLAPFVWGRQLWNELLPSSRPTHMAINGLKLRKGSEADRRAGHPPWSYNCTCTETLLISSNPAGEGKHIEPVDAYARVAAIKRFAS